MNLGIFHRQCYVYRLDSMLLMEIGYISVIIDTFRREAWEISNKKDNSSNNKNSQSNLLNLQWKWALTLYTMEIPENVVRFDGISLDRIACIKTHTHTIHLNILLNRKVVLQKRNSIEAPSNPADFEELNWIAGFFHFLLVRLNTLLLERMKKTLATLS